MERYHIYKLGIAIIFYAIYYRRATIVYALATQQDSNGGEYVYYQGVQGKPGIDFPVYARIPKTSFSCRKVESGYYADLETSCQVFHICNGGAKISFLCPNGTIFQQSDLICEWWFKVNCTNSPSFYSESAELLREGSWKRKNSHRKTPSQHRNSSSSRRNKPQYQNDNNSNRRSDLNNRVNDEGVVQNVDVPKKVDNGDRGGRKFKGNYDNLNVPNELTEDNDYGNSDEAQIPEETASFYKNNKHNTIEPSDKPTTHKYANHKETYTEITQPKYYSTKGSQTIPPQTYSTNRIPLNDGKPFVVSTPKSAYNIQVSSFSSGTTRDYNRGTTESFKYSPTVPPFTSKQIYTTTARPRIIVEAESNGYVSSSTAGIQNLSGDFGGRTGDVTVHESEYTTPNSNRLEPNRSGDFDGYTHDVTVQKFEYTTPNSSKIEPNRSEDFGGSTDDVTIHKSQYTTPNSSRFEPNRSGDFSGNTHDVTIHESQYTTPNSNRFEPNRSGDFGGSTHDVTVHKSQYTTPNSNRIEPNRSGGISFTERINTFSGLDDIVHTPTTSKYETSRNGGFDITDGYSNQRYETTTKDSYYPPVVYATSAKYGTESGVQSNGNNLGISPNVLEISTKQSGYDSNHARSNYETTTNTNRKGFFDAFLTNRNNNQFETITTRDGVTASEIKKQRLPPNLNSAKNEYEPPKVLSTNINSTNFEPPSVYNDGNLENLSISSRNIDNINKANTISDITPPNANIPTQNTLKSAFETTESSYGDACGDDIVYTELPQDQIVVGKQKIVIDDTSVPTTETNSIKLKVNNLQDNIDLKTNSPPTKAAGDSTIFRINVKYGQDSDNASEKPSNGFYVTKQQSQSGFSNANTYLPTQASTTENYNGGITQTKSHTYLPNSATPSPFALSENSADLLKLTNKEVLEPNRVPQIRKTSAGVSQISEDILKTFALRPKPFELPPKETETTPYEYLPKNGQAITGAPVPDYSISSARPFSLDGGDSNTVAPTLATPYPSDDGKITEHLKNMLQTLKDIINDKGNDTENVSARSGLVVPPSVGPQTLHTLAVYFSNALDGVHPENGKENPAPIDETEAVKQLLTKMTVSGYHDLFKGEKEGATTTEAPEENTEDLEGQHSKTSVTPRVRQLAQVFTKALSSYLDDPDTFKKVLEEARPTEPAPTDSSGTSGSDDDELLNYSDADIKPHLPRLSTTTIAPVPTWGYILAPNNSNAYEHNSIIPDGEHLQSADSQSFASQFNNYIKEKHFGKEASTTPQNLPSDHWTSSANATKLWQDKLYTNPQAINENLNISIDAPVDSRESGSSESVEISPQINYGISDLPKTEMNSTEVHKILVDIINSTKDEGGNKLKRILSKLNTTQEEFLLKMKEIEQNPLTRRLILLLISECGSNITHLENRASAASGSSSGDTASLFESSRVAEQDKYVKGSSPFPVYVDPHLKDEDQDNRALQLLNSLYTIASKYGK